MVNLSNQKLRDLGGVFKGSQFPSLTELNVEQNLLADISDIFELKRLAILNVNYNRLGETFSFSRHAQQGIVGSGANQGGNPDV